MTYEWDAGKARLNQKKHGVEFEEAASVFLDPYSPPEERRKITIGCTLKGRMVFVSHRERGIHI